MGSAIIGGWECQRLGCSWIARQMRSGVAGIGTSVTPSGARASRIAFMTVGGGAQRAAGDHHAARGVSAAADRDLVGVGLREMDLVLRHAEPIRDYGFR